MNNTETQGLNHPVHVICGTVRIGSQDIALRSGDVLIATLVDAYMSVYRGKDQSIEQRMRWWQAKIGHLTLSNVDEDHIYFDRLIIASVKRPSKPFSHEHVWHKALKIAKVHKFRFHDLRHTCASYLAQNGATLLEIGDVLGQRQQQVTKRYRLAGFFFSAGGGACPARFYFDH